MKITESQLRNLIQESIEEALGMSFRDRMMGNRYARNANNMQNIATQGNWKHDINGNFNNNYYESGLLSTAFEKIFKNRAGGDNTMRKDAIYVNKQIDDLIGKVKKDLSQLNFASGYLNKIVQGDNFVAKGHKSKGRNVARKAVGGKVAKQPAQPTTYQYQNAPSGRGGLGISTGSRLRSAAEMSSPWMGSVNEGIFDAFKVKRAEKVFQTYRTIKDPQQAAQALKSIEFLRSYYKNMLAKLKQARTNNMQTNNINAVNGNMPASAPAPANPNTDVQQQYKRVDEAVANAIKKVLK